MPSIAQVFRRNKKESLEAAKRRVFEARIEQLAKVQTGLLDPDKPLAERVHALMLANRPNAAPALPEPVKPAAPLFDLIIATRRACKFGGNVQSSDGKITRIKKAGAGEDWQEPKAIWRLSDPAIQKRLAGYKLIDQVALATEIWHRYQKIGE